MRARQAMPPWAPTPITVACLRDPLCEDLPQEVACPGGGFCLVCHGHGCGGGLSVGRQPLLVPLARVWQGHGMSCVGYGEGVWLECFFPKGRVSSFTGSPVRTLTGHTGSGSIMVAFSPDGQWIASGSNAPFVSHAMEGRTLRIWKFSDGMCGGGCMKFACGGFWQPTPTLPHPPACR